MTWSAVAVRVVATWMAASSFSAWSAHATNKMEQTSHLRVVPGNVVPPGSRGLSGVETTCLGSSLPVDGIIRPNESLCTKVKDEMVYFGIWTYLMPSDPGYTMYRVEMRSENGTYDRQFSGIGTKDEPPVLKLQGDGNWIFDTQGFSQCIVKPGRTPAIVTLIEEDDDVALQVVDTTGDVIWRLGARGCYPFVPDKCVSALYKDERLSWKEFLCTYDSDGSVLFQFGLSHDMGLFGLWHENQLVWRPSTNGNWIRGNYLHLQEDGHLTIYKDTSPKTFQWTSKDCVDFTAEKLVLTSDGDVQELNHAGAIVWSLKGSQHGPTAYQDERNTVPELCMPKTTCVVPPTTPLFHIKEDVGIGDTLTRPEPGFTKTCGPRCYDVMDNGDDPPDDPELGDTLRFAYKPVKSDKFFFRAKVCGTKCDGDDWAWDDVLGRAGLMVRENLDPMSKNLFVSHRPNYQADWSYRNETKGSSYYNMDGSPDVECLWVSLERHSHDTFTFAYNYESFHDDPECHIDEWSLLNTTLTIDMPEEILLGLAVSTGIAPPFCSYTQARFSEIQLELE